MSWKIRHQGSPQAREAPLSEIVEGLLDGIWEPSDEVQAPGEAAWTAIENHPQLAEFVMDFEEKPASHADETTLDFNALIDVCLVLLIFFMMTTTYAVAVQKTVPLPAEQEIKEKTKGVPVVSLDRVRRTMVRVQADMLAGKPVVRVEGLEVNVVRADGTLDIEKMREELLKYTHTALALPRDEVLLDAKGVNWGFVIAIQDAARAANVRVINYASLKKN
jgi:biopolymer transport protein ExbD